LIGLLLYYQPIADTSTLVNCSPQNASSDAFSHVDTQPVSGHQAVTKRFVLPTSIIDY
jgi:hypothetical protein